MWTRVRLGCFFVLCCAAAGLIAVPAVAQQTAGRVTAAIDENQRFTIQGTHPPLARLENDTGRVPSGMPLQGVKITFSRSAAQEADLEALISAQQDPASSLYHKWLMPTEFATRFGVADADIAKVRSWLEGHGFTVEEDACSKTCVRFSGAVGEIERALGTELHYYWVDGEKHFAPSYDVSVPAALASVVATVTNLSSFRPKPLVRFAGPRLAPDPNFTSSQTGDHFLTPKDVATIYDINPAYKAGYNGTGQSIAVVGQSAIVLSDIEHFQTAAGFPIKDPMLIQKPNTGTATINPGDEGESDLDLEYTSTIASGATIYFVYVGNSSNQGVWDAIDYAVTQQIAPIISVSYGICEPSLGSAGYASLNPMLQQAATQGQSVIVASGDSGSTDCYPRSGNPSQPEGLAVDFPASSQYVTALGGTEFLTADVASTNTTYWQPANGSDLVSSALSYIPEQVWNDDTAAGSAASGGGGVSTLTARPSWQTGVPGIPSGTFRVVPDISLSSSASPVNAPYLFCSSDTSFGVTGSCSNGLRASDNKTLTAAGGTSFAAPVFAGMLAIINDKLNSSGQGVVASTLYSLAANASTYASAFHDITTGGNQCTLGSTDCSSAAASQYAATTGYDPASGLGSVDFFNLLSAWPGSSTAPVPSKTTVSAATTTPASGANDVITITVASASSSSTTTPTGTLTITVDGTAQTPTLTLANGSATYTFSSTVAGSHTIAATYSGDSTYAASNGSVTVTVSAPAPPVANAQSVTTAANTAKAITLTATPGTAGDTLTYTIVSQPAHGTLTGAAPNVTYTPASGYAGADSFTFDATENGVTSNTATVSITVTAGTPPPPIANPQSVTTSANTAKAITLTATPGTAGDTLTYTIVSQPAHGTLSGTAPNVTYTPTSGYAGADSFTFHATENGITSNTATVSITVTAAAPPPVANAQSVTTAANTAKAITLTATPGTTGDTLTYAIVSQPSHGTLTGTAPNVTYTPTSGYAGSDSFTFHVTENGITSNTATVSITVTAAPPAPVANNQSVSTNMNTATAITLTGTPGTSGDTLSFTIVTNPAHGSLTGTAPNVTYTPASNYVGADSFTFKLTESNGATSTTPGTVSITVVKPTPVTSKTTLSAATTTPAPGASDAITITVASASTSSTATPTGTLNVTVDGTAAPSSLSLANGSATYTFSSAVAGAHTIAATYSGDSTYAASTGSLTVTVPAAKSFKLAASNVTVSAGSSGSSTVTITPQNGYTGTISWGVSASPALTNGCFSMANATLTAASAATTALTINTMASACVTPAMALARPTTSGTIVASNSGNGAPPLAALAVAPSNLALAGLLFVGFFGRRSRKLATFAAVCVFAGIGLVISGCAGAASSTAPAQNPTPTAAKGSYTITIVGTDTASASITASTTLSLTID